MKLFLFLILIVGCKATFHSSSDQPGPEANKTTPKPVGTPNPISPINTPEPGIINPVTNFSMMTITYSERESKLEQFQVKLKGSPNDWQDVSYSTGGEAYIPNLCDADHVSNVAIRGRHNGCAFVVGQTSDTKISNSSMNKVSFDLSEKCDSMQNPTTIFVYCKDPGLKLVAP